METAIIAAIAALLGILIGLFYKSITGEQGATVNRASVETTTQALRSTSDAMSLYRDLNSDFVALRGRVETLETEREEMLETIKTQNEKLRAYDNKIAQQDIIIADLTTKNAELQRQITENKDRAAE